MNIQYHGMTFGADPELFLTKNGAVIGAEKVLPKDGIRHEHAQELKVVIIDGVQAEFNVPPQSCREYFSDGLRHCFTKLYEATVKEGVEVSFKQNVEIEKEELESLSPESQQFGCAPSKNAYAESKISITDASTHYQRSAGGHIHLGGADDQTIALFKKPEDIVPLLDIIVGNTCVLIDRDPGNAERRKIYGKAGEYRLPPHGLEYRTLSNFWLRSYPVMSLVLALARFAVCIALDPEAKRQILESVDMEDIQSAINNNDFEAAQKNFDKIKSIISNISALNASSMLFPLEGRRVQYFEQFVKMGLDHWFKDDPLTYWVSGTNRRMGWERFLDLTVAAETSIKSPISNLARETK